VNLSFVAKFDVGVSDEANLRRVEWKQLSNTRGRVDIEVENSGNSTISSWLSFGSVVNVGATGVVAPSEGGFVIRTEEGVWVEFELRDAGGQDVSGWWLGPPMELEANVRVNRPRVHGGEVGLAFHWDGLSIAAGTSTRLTFSIKLGMPQLEAGANGTVAVRRDALAQGDGPGLWPCFELGVEDLSSRWSLFERGERMARTFKTRFTSRMDEGEPIVGRVCWHLAVRTDSDCAGDSVSWKAKQYVTANWGCSGPAASIYFQDCNNRYICWLNMVFTFRKYDGAFPVTMSFNPGFGWSGDDHQHRCDNVWLPRSSRALGDGDAAELRRDSDRELEPEPACNGISGGEREPEPGTDHSPREREPESARNCD
jgi:hypothetical protein